MMEERDKKAEGEGINVAKAQTQKLLGKILVTIFFAYLANSIYPQNQLLGILVLLFGLFLAWGD